MTFVRSILGSIILLTTCFKSVRDTFNLYRRSCDVEKEKVQRQSQRLAVSVQQK